MPSIVLVTACRAQSKMRYRNGQTVVSLPWEHKIVCAKKCWHSVNSGIPTRNYRNEMKETAARNRPAGKPTQRVAKLNRTHGCDVFFNRPLAVGKDGVDMDMDNGCSPAQNPNSILAWFCLHYYFSYISILLLCHRFPHACCLLCCVFLSLFFPLFPTTSH